VLVLCSREEVGMLLGLCYDVELFARKKVAEHLSHPVTLVTVGDRIISVLDNALLGSLKRRWPQLIASKVFTIPMPRFQGFRINSLVFKYNNQSQATLT
jgi:hypothetical protein